MTQKVMSPEQVHGVANLVSRNSTIVLKGDIDHVFPLFGPIREMEWAEGWSPEIFYGSGEVSERMVFRTTANNPHEDFFQWIVTRYEPGAHRIGYAVSATDRVWFIDVECKMNGDRTLATITYTYIGMTDEGHERNRAALEKMFENNLLDWEEAINCYLKTGQKLITI